MYIQMYENKNKLKEVLQTIASVTNVPVYGKRSVGMETIVQEPKTILGLFIEKQCM